MKEFSRFYPQLILLILFSVSLTSIAIAEDQKVEKRLNVAVLDLEISGGIPEIYQKTLSDRLRLELLNTGRFNVIERNAMEEVLSEQGFQMSGCTSDECAVEVGRLLGVQGIIAGSIGKVGNTHSIILRHISVETGLIIASKGVDCPCPIDEVKRAITEVVNPRPMTRPQIFEVVIPKYFMQRRLKEYRTIINDLTFKEGRLFPDRRTMKLKSKLKPFQSLL